MSATKPLIVNELLAFLQQRLDLMGSLSVISICSTSFTVAEICSAKELLYRSLNLSGSFVPHRRGDETGTKTLQDIVKVFVETDPHQLPTFVAKQLSKLPPLTYEEVDAASLRKDVVALKATLAKILGEFEASKVVIAELRDEVAKLNIAAATTGSATTAEAARLARNTDDGAPTTSNGAPTTPRSLTLQVQPAALAVPPAPAPAPLPRAPTLPAAPAPPRRSARAPAAGPAAGRTVTVPRRPPAPPPPVQSACKAKQLHRVDEEGFTLVEKKKRRASRPPRKSQCGTAETESDSCLPVAVPNTALYVSRLHHSCVAVDVTEYVRQKTSHTLRVFKLEPRHYTHFTSFVVRVPRPLMDTIAKEEFWPKGVVFRRFRGTMPRPAELATSTARRPA